MIFFRCSPLYAPSLANNTHSDDARNNSCDRERTSNICELIVSSRPEPYQEAIAAIENRSERIIKGSASPLVWVLSHDALYTAGVSTRPEHLLLAQNTHLPLYKTGRGGQLTYHDPGQRIVYLCLDLKQHDRDVRLLVSNIEISIINALKNLGVKEAFIREKITGVWVPAPARSHQHVPFVVSEASAVNSQSKDVSSVNNKMQIDSTQYRRYDKIAAIGLRVRRWVTLYGFCVNVSSNLNNFGRIIPCGIDPSDGGVTNLSNLGIMVSHHAVDCAIIHALSTQFGLSFGDIDVNDTINHAHSSHLDGNHQDSAKSNIERILQDKTP